ncbi:hypothetical protein SAMN04487968_102311 [Nocardioides terrae]|uniref:Uncharacterized protein n=1 Tax=Nocardioides terrae TaxID=574651 RepID=A0A1I1F0A3_9ACTN|nr:hypothetical protein [Nocardioides terrae]SFB92322.1 hypothetical protein SAMN04487968_102311 [Nocardioides terrae]
MSTTRWCLGLLGTALAFYGGWLLLTRGHDLGNALVWLAAGVVLHDGVLALVTVAVGLAASRLLPGPARAPVAAGLVVLGSVTLLAIPVLGRFGARADNPTLLDRDYVAGYLGLVALTAAVVGLATLVGSRRRRR